MIYIFMHETNEQQTKWHIPRLAILILALRYLRCKSSISSVYASDTTSRRDSSDSAIRGNTEGTQLLVGTHLGTKGAILALDSVFGGVLDTKPAHQLYIFNSVVHIGMYTYIYRERERGCVCARMRGICACQCVCVCVCVRRGVGACTLHH